MMMKKILPLEKEEEDAAGEDATVRNVGKSVTSCCTC